MYTKLNNVLVSQTEPVYVQKWLYESEHSQKLVSDIPGSTTYSVGHIEVDEEMVTMYLYNQEDEPDTMTNITVSRKLIEQLLK